LFNAILEGFHSRAQQPCKFVGTKEISSTGLVWYTNMAAISLFWDTNMAAAGDVM